MLSAEFLAETFVTREGSHSTFIMKNGKNLQPRIHYPSSLLFRFNEEIKSFTDKEKLSESSPTQADIQQMLMKLEPIIQSEVSQKEKHQYSILMHIYGI